MSERSPSSAAYPPEYYVGALQDFLAETGSAVRTQLSWLQMGRRFLGPEKSQMVDAAITSQIAANVARAGHFIESLGNWGMSVIVVGQDGDRHPMLGLGFEPTTGLYEAGIPTPQGPAMMPLNDTVHLDIHSRF